MSDEYMRQGLLKERDEDVDVDIEEDTDADGKYSSNFDELRKSVNDVASALRNQKQRAWWHSNWAEREKARQPWRKKLGESLESTPSHVFIVTLLLVDLFATAVDILKTIHNKTYDLDSCTSLLETCHCVDQFEKTESWEFVYWISIGILTILILNVACLLLAFGLSFFSHPGYVLDLVVVGTALFLEIFLDSDTVGLLIILTLWRIVRVAHGIFEVTDEAWEQEIHKLEARIKDAESMHFRDQDLLRQKDERIAELENPIEF